MRHEEQPFQISQEWQQETARRCREIDEGVVDLIPGDEVLAEAAEELRSLRRHIDST